jgi:hypothetical protein
MVGLDNGDTPLGYRPNWGLPGMTGTGQTGAPVLCSSASVLAPGGSAHAVIIPLTGAHLVQWRLLGQGDKLRMFEGPRVCGHATVRWAENTVRPVPPPLTGHTVSQAGLATVRPAFRAASMRCLS